MLLLGLRKAVIRNLDMIKWSSQIANVYFYYLWAVGGGG